MTDRFDPTNEDYGSDVEHDSGEVLLGTFRAKVVGLRYYSGLVGVREGIQVEREPRNPYDANAIRVLNVRRQQVGHIERDVARFLAPVMDRQKIEVDGTIPFGRGNTYSMPVDLSLYGPIEKLDLVTSMLQRGRIHLRDPVSTTQMSRVVQSVSQHSTEQPKRKHPYEQPAPPPQLSLVELEAQGLDNMLKQLGISVDVDMPEKEPVDIVVTNLHPHQKQALHWMTKIEGHDNPDAASELPLFWKKENGRYFNSLCNFSQTARPEKFRGAILADDMGLGKTLETIALIASTHTAGQPTLVVAPLAVILNWEQQLARHVKEGSLPFSVFHLQNRPSADKLSKFQVVITTYGTVRAEFQRKGSSPLYKVKWLRVVLDEAHLIKNPKSGQALACGALTAKYRWCLTGTPFQNRIDDMQSLLRFLKVDTLSEPEWWGSIIKRPLKEKKPEALDRLRVITNSLCLRRTKDLFNIPEGEEADAAAEAAGDASAPGADADADAEMTEAPPASQESAPGRPLSQESGTQDQSQTLTSPLSQSGSKRSLRVVLPKKTIAIQWVELSRPERDYYEVLRLTSRRQLQRWRAEGPVGNHYAQLVSILTRMRQLCDHARLLPEAVLVAVRQCLASLAVGRTPSAATVQQAMTAIELIPENELNHLLSLLVKKQAEDECCICLGEPENASITRCGHVFCGSCLDTLLQSTTSCPLCRQEIKRSEVITKALADKAEARSKKRRRIDDDDMKDDNDDDEEEEEEDKEPEDDEDDDYDEDDAYEAALKRKREQRRRSQELPAVGEKRLRRSSRRASRASLLGSGFADEDEEDGKAASKADSPKPPKRKKEQKKEPPAPQELAPGAHLQSATALTGIDSSKLRAIVEILYRNRDKGIKTVVFSQWTSFLDVIQEAVIKHEFGFGRLDGRMSRRERNRNLIALQEDPKVTVFLISLMAGGVGLDLTSASCAILTDPWWNPAVEAQAIDRIHRIGQTRPVEVFRLIVKDSVESRMLDLHRKKQVMMEVAFESPTQATAAQVKQQRLDDLAALLD